MALFCNNHANLPIHKWHSITRKSSAKSLQGTPLISWRKGRCVKDIPVRPTPLLAIHVNQCTSFATQKHRVPRKLASLRSRRNIYRTGGINFACKEGQNKRHGGQ